MEHFGDILDRLMGARKLTSQRLAALAGCSSSLLRNSRRDDRCRWRTANRMSVLSALHKELPLGKEEMEMAVRSGLATDMEELRATLRLTGEGPAESSSPNGTRKTKQAFAAFLATCTPTEREVFITAGRLVGRLGPDIAARLLYALETGQAVARGPEIESRGRQLAFVSDVHFSDEPPQLGRQPVQKRTARGA